MPPKRRAVNNTISSDNASNIDNSKGDNMKKPKVQTKLFVELNIEEHLYLTRLEEKERIFFFTELVNINCDHGEKIPLRFKIIKSKIPKHIKPDIFKKITSECSPKYDIWVQNVLQIPFDTFVERKRSYNKKRLLTTAKYKMDCALVGHSKAKDEILRILYQWIVNPHSNKIPIGLEGPPGVGKTTFAKNALSVLNKPIIFMSLGGAQDSSYLVGHSYTYEGAICGRIVDALKEAKCMDPIIYFDELDKISDSSKGAEIINTLVHIIDPAQNDKFRDKYIGFDIDLSNVIFVFSYNNPEKVCPILLDRIQRIQCDSPTIEQKIQIAREHLMPRCAQKFNLKEYLNYYKLYIRRIRSSNIRKAPL
jgi:ATP-dependent Lon protease